MVKGVVGSASVELKFEYKKNLKQAVNDIQKEVGKISVQAIADKNSKVITELEDKIKKLEEALKGVNTEAKEGGSSSGGMSTFNKQLQQMAVRVVSVQTAFRLVKTAINTFIQSTRDFAKFDAQLRTTSVISGGLEENFEKLKNVMYDIGKSPITTDINKINDSMYKLASAGLDASEIMETLPTALRTSVGVGEDLDKTISLLVSTINGFNLDFSESPKVMDLFAKAVANSQATIEKLEVGLARVSPIAQNLGVDLETTVGVFGKLVNTGLSASRSGTVLVNTFKGLSSFTPKSTKAIENLGLAVTDVDLQFNSLDDALERLADTNFTDSDLQDIFGTRGKLISGILRNLQEGRRLKDLVNDITGTGGAEIFSQAQLGTLDQSITKLENSIVELKNTSIELSSGTLIKTLDSISDYVENIIELIKEAQKLTNQGRGIEGALNLEQGIQNESPIIRSFNPLSIVSKYTTPIIGKVLGDIQEQIGIRRGNSGRNGGASENQKNLGRNALNQDYLDASLGQTRPDVMKYLDESTRQSLATQEALTITTKIEQDVAKAYEDRAVELHRQYAIHQDADKYNQAITKLEEAQKNETSKRLAQIGTITKDSGFLSEGVLKKLQDGTLGEEFLANLNKNLITTSSNKARTIAPSDRGDNVDLYGRSVLASVTNSAKQIRTDLKIYDDVYKSLTSLSENNSQIFKASNFEGFIEQIPEVYKTALGLNNPDTKAFAEGKLLDVYNFAQDPEIAELLANRSKKVGALLFEQLLGEEGIEQILGQVASFSDSASGLSDGVNSEYKGRIEQIIASLNGTVLGQMLGYQKMITQANLFDDSEITDAFNEIEKQTSLLPNTLEKISKILYNLTASGEMFDADNVLEQLTDSERGAFASTEIDLGTLIGDVMTKNVTGTNLPPKTATDIARMLLGNPKVVDANIKAIQESHKANADILGEFLSRGDLTPEQIQMANDMKDLNDANVISSVSDQFNNLADATEEVVDTMDKMVGFTSGLGPILGQIGDLSGSDYLSNLGGSIGGLGKAFKSIQGINLKDGDLFSKSQGVFDIAQSGLQFGSFANALLGQDPSTGSTIGSLVGTGIGYSTGTGAVGGAIGGALGGAVGGLFGGGDKNKEIAKQREQQQMQQQAVKDFSSAVEKFVNAIEESGIETAFENLSSIVNAPTDVDAINKALSSGRYGSDNVEGDIIRELLPQLNDDEIVDLLRASLGGGGITHGDDFDTGFGTRGGFNTEAFAKEIARVNEEMTDGITDSIVNALEISTENFKDAFKSTLFTSADTKGEFEDIISNAYQNALSNTGTVVAFSDKLQKLLIGDIENVIKDPSFGLGVDVGDFKTVEEALEFMQSYSENSNAVLDEIIDKYGLVGLQISKIESELENGLLKLQAEGVGTIAEQSFELSKLKEQMALLEEGTTAWYEIMIKIKNLEEEIYDNGIAIQRTRDDTGDIRNLITAYESEAKALERLYEDIAIARERNDLEAIVDLEKAIAELEEKKAISIKNSLSQAVYSGLAEGFTSSGNLDLDDLGEQIKKQVYTAQLDNIIESILNSAEINQAINDLTRSIEDGATDEAESILDGLLGLIDGSLEGFEDQIDKIEEILGADANTDPIVFFDEQNLEDTLGALDTVGDRELEGKTLDEKTINVKITKDGGTLTEEELQRIADIISTYGIQVDTSNII